jgi:hypothetical protein
MMLGKAQDFIVSTAVLDLGNRLDRIESLFVESSHTFNEPLSIIFVEFWI